MLDTTIGPCRILRKISQGGMGIVYAAIHEAIERFVAINRNKRTTPDRLEFRKYDPRVRKHVLFRESK